MASLNQIDHFVVLMLENRSFDNLLGFLLPAGADFEGLTGYETNPDGQGKPVQVWTDPGNPTTLSLPDPDPGESFVDMNAQLFGEGPVAGMPGMKGFVQDYVKQGGAAQDIMHCFSPEQIPALTALARSYAVSDRWFASAPCQTWPNRFFVHTATANGYENNSPAHFPYMMPTIFNALEGQAPSGWKIYFHDFPQSLTLTELQVHLDRFRPFTEFLDDAKTGSLPSYSFIEPRYFADADWPNDMHPPHNVAYGDQLVASVYDAVRQSSCWNSTLLVITFDEHGGCFDHVPPPNAVSPEPPRTGQVFAFDRYGVRVPAILVSPFIKPGTILRSDNNYPFDHTSIIRTLRSRFGIDKPLSQRDAVAPDLSSVLNLDEPSDDRREAVQAAPSPPGDNEEALNAARLAPLNGFQQAAQDAMAHLEPLARGIPLEQHIQALLNGWVPTLPKATGSGAAVQDIKDILDKWLP
ncbi:MAG: phosphoesterase [Pseudomonadota bacterium]|nr:phosphoesterase [Pseudomonadota bacterium]